MVVNKSKNNKLQAFTITEALMVMILVTIFIAATANVFVKKTQSKVKAESHGRFECFYIGNDLYQHKVFQGIDNGIEKVTTSDGFGGYCEYTPTRFTKYVMINAVGGGADRVPADPPSVPTAIGGKSGMYKSLFYPSPLYKYRLYPGKKNEQSFVRAKPSAAEPFEEIAVANQAPSVKTIDSTTIEDLTSCVVEDDASRHTALYGNYFDCGASGRCTVNKEDGTIIVDYCRTSGQYRDDKLHYNDPEYEVKLRNTDKDGNIVKDRNGNNITTSSVEKLKDVPDAHWKHDFLDRYQSIVHAPNNEVVECNASTNSCDYHSMTIYTSIGLDPLQSDFCTPAQKENYSYICSDDNDKMSERDTAPDKQKKNLKRYKEYTNSYFTCLYKLQLGVTLSNGKPEGEISGLSRYIEVMQYQGTGATVIYGGKTYHGIEDIKPGNGGDAPSVSGGNPNGHAGGILLLY